MRYPIPDATARAWATQKKRDPQNPGLIFDRFAPVIGEDPRDNAKRDGFLAVVEAAKRADRGLFEAGVARWRKVAAAIHARIYPMVTDWRMVAGLGRKGSLEAGFTFSRCGFPYLPASSIKGMTRAMGLIELGAALQVDDLDALDTLLSLDAEQFHTEFDARFSSCPAAARILVELFRGALGHPDHAGRAVFLDGIPVRFPTLELDIMNPHYPRYYQENQPPANWQSPTPILFLTVAGGVDFEFAAGWRGGPPPAAWLETLERWLLTGLQELGIGAKTGAGYGYFRKAARPGAEALAAAAPEAQAAAPAPQAADPARLAWKPGRITDGGRAVADLARPDLKYRFQQAQVLPRGYTPANKAEVDYAIETLPDGRERAWVKQKYYPVGSRG